jgi:hypothetical protein
MSLTPALTGLLNAGATPSTPSSHACQARPSRPPLSPRGTDASGVSAHGVANTLGCGLLGGPLGEVLELDGRTVAEPALTHGFVQRFVAVHDDDIHAPCWPPSALPATPPSDRRIPPQPRGRGRPGHLAT